MQRGPVMLGRGKAELTMVLLVVTSGSVFPSDRPFMLVSKQAGRHWEALLDTGSVAVVSVSNLIKGTRRRLWKRICPFVCLGVNCWHLAVRLS